jgi:hypothetical protein
MPWWGWLIASIFGAYFLLMAVVIAATLHNNRKIQKAVDRTEEEIGRWDYRYKF